MFAAKVRRLYDIANVLRSLKLIEKVHVTEERGRKPAFEWVGPEEFPQIKGITRSPLITVSILIQYYKECLYFGSNVNIIFVLCRN